ncbi:hypothetical protein [Algoriphagus sp. AK58]|uniref:hypothetical protein n=1 Tax=Algoriphagus sp. AK58 TaxID=1406877 RepID=UPI00165080DD|nr:hypothetical protein [Algoriphagus sp. AK58]
MKTLLLLLLFAWIGPIQSLVAQQDSNKFLIEEYLQQSEKQKKAGWTFIGVGAAATGLGSLLALTSDDWDSAGFGTGLVLFVGGGAMMVIGIPILISSSAKARKAGKLSLGVETVRTIQPNMNFSGKTVPTVTLSFPLNQ